MVLNLKQRRVYFSKLEILTLIGYYSWVYQYLSFAIDFKT